MAIIATPVEVLDPAAPAGSAVSCPPVTVTGELPGDCTSTGRSPDWTPSCDDPCSNIFAHVTVFPTIRFGARIEWVLHPLITDPGPYEFQLQVGRTGISGADDWESVGTPAFDVNFMLDDEDRVYGKTQWTHYRICVRTPLDTYFSLPADSWGDLDYRDRRIYRTSLRTWHKQLKLSDGTDGYLLKRKLHGTKCDNDCIDFLTGEVTNPQCPECQGTGFLAGYFAPEPCIYAGLERKVSHNELDGAIARGTINDRLRVRADMLAVPQLFERDVWASKLNDLRWAIHEIQSKVEVRGLPVVVSVELRLMPFSDLIYSIEMPDQIPA